MADGKTSPFGNGAGNVAGADASMIDFTKQPGGSTPVPGQPSGEADDIASAQTPAGGTLLLADATPLPGKDLGVGTVGGGAKPFKLDGGGA